MKLKTFLLNLQSNQIDQTIRTVLCCFILKTYQTKNEYTFYQIIILFYLKFKTIIKSSILCICIRSSCFFLLLLYLRRYFFVSVIIHI